MKNAPAGTVPSNPGPAGATRSFHWRAAVALGVVAALHLVGAGLLLGNLALGAGAAIPLGLAAIAYTRGLLHAMDFDHIAMIDNSTRKLLAEGRRPVSIGLAFSAGHSTVVVVTGVAVVAGSTAVRGLFAEHSRGAAVLGLIGVSVSGLYLLLIALANTATVRRAWELRRQLQQQPDTVITPEDLRPRGVAARLLAAPLRRVRHPAHVYVVGVLFSLGFDTSSQIGLLMLTAAAGLAGAPPIGLLALPLLFAAAMTLGDTLNGIMMLKVYENALTRPAHMITYNLVVTSVSIVAAVVVAVVAAAELLSEGLGLGGVAAAVSGLDTSSFGFVLLGLMLVIGAAGLLWRRRTASRA